MTHADHPERHAHPWAGPETTPGIYLPMTPAVVLLALA